MVRLLLLLPLLIVVPIDRLHVSLIDGQVVLHQGLRLRDILLHRFQHQLLVEDGIEGLHLVAGLLGLQVGRGQDERSEDERRQHHGDGDDLGDLHRVSLAHLVGWWCLTGGAVHLTGRVVLLHRDGHRVRFLLQHCGGGSLFFFLNTRERIHGLPDTDTHTYTQTRRDSTRTQDTRLSLGGRRQRRRFTESLVAWWRDSEGDVRTVEQSRNV
uniref:Putative secreted protein n=1 Tax=Anopheles darlingi TaxID=43151 RepID=A0A2M4DE14_ANODA